MNKPLDNKISPEFHTNNNKSIDIKQDPIKPTIMKHKQSISFPLIILFISLIAITSQYDQAVSQDEVMAYHEAHSHKPILQVYHNRHFSKSRQFQDFKDVVFEVQREISKYAKVLFVDCEKSSAKSKDLQAPHMCLDIAKANQNRAILGYRPSTEFTTFGSKLIQSPPRSRALNHFSDQYTEEELIAFVQELIPQFFRPLHSLQQYENFLKPRYVPKMLFFWNEDDPESIPQVIKRLTIEYYLRFDFGFVQDLNRQIMQKLQMVRTPALLVIKYDFKLQKYLVYQYPRTSFPEDSYGSLAKFIEVHALKEPRNDFLFHKISFETPNSGEIQIVQSAGELYQIQERASGWIVIQENPDPNPEKLAKLREKYGDYFEYVHLRLSEAQQSEQAEQKRRMMLFSPKQQERFGFQTDIAFKALGFDDFVNNATLFLNKDYLILGVRQQYSHLCALAQKTLFRGIVQCLIAEESSYEKIAESIGSSFEIGIICTKKYDDKGYLTNKITGSLIDSSRYYPAYRSLQYNTRLKIKHLMDKMVTRPIDPVIDSTRLLDICAFPTKKCVLLLSNPEKKVNAKKDYLKQVALSFAEEYKIFEIDPRCNEDFILEMKLAIENINEEIEENRNQTSGRKHKTREFDENSEQLIVFHPQSSQWSIMSRKFTKASVHKFLKENFGEKRKLQLQPIQNKVLLLRNYVIGKDQMKQDQEESENQLKVRQEEEL